VEGPRAVRPPGLTPHQAPVRARASDVSTRQPARARPAPPWDGQRPERGGVAYGSKRERPGYPHAAAARMPTPSSRSARSRHVWVVRGEEPRRAAIGLVRPSAMRATTSGSLSERPERRSTAARQPGCWRVPGTTSLLPLRIDKRWRADILYARALRRGTSWCLTRSGLSRELSMSH
jgi:hypothetical protein